jgi:hypothetical protein
MEISRSKRNEILCYPPAAIPSPCQPSAMIRRQYKRSVHGTPHKKKNMTTRSGNKTNLLLTALISLTNTLTIQYTHLSPHIHPTRVATHYTINLENEIMAYDSHIHIIRLTQTYKPNIAYKDTSQKRCALKSTQPLLLSFLHYPLFFSSAALLLLSRSLIPFNVAMSSWLDSTIVVGRPILEFSVVHRFARS